MSAKRKNEDDKEAPDTKDEAVDKRPAKRARIRLESLAKRPLKYEEMPSMGAINAELKDMSFLLPVLDSIVAEYARPACARFFAGGCRGWDCGMCFQGCRHHCNCHSCTHCSVTVKATDPQCPGYLHGGIFRGQCDGCIDCCEHVCYYGLEEFCLGGAVTKYNEQWLCGGCMKRVADEELTQLPDLVDE